MFDEPRAPHSHACEGRLETNIRHVIRASIEKRFAAFNMSCCELLGNWWKDQRALKLSHCLPGNWFSEGECSQLNFISIALLLLIILSFAKKKRDWIEHDLHTTKFGFFFSFNSLLPWNIASHIKSFFYVCHIWHVIYIGPDFPV